MLKVRLHASRASKMFPRGGRFLGQVEESFVETLVPATPSCSPANSSSTRLWSTTKSMSRARPSEDPKVPAYEGGKFPLSTYLADRVRAIISDPREWRTTPEQCASGSKSKNGARRCRAARELLVETFPRANKHYLVCIRSRAAGASDARHAADAPLERARFEADGFCRQRICAGRLGPRRLATRDCRRELSLAALFDEDMLGDDLEAWLAELALMKRTFRSCAIIAGLIERRFPARKNPGGRSRSRPISSMTCSAATSPTTCCCARAGRCRNRPS